MHLSAFRQWIRNVYTTQDEEADCDQVLQALPEYVDSEVAGEDLSQYSREIKAHLNQCAECHDLYITVRDAAFVEREAVVSKITAD